MCYQGVFLSIAELRCRNVCVILDHFGMDLWFS